MNELIELKERFEGIVKSTERFPVDFDEAWQWVGYSTKGNALRVLQTNFESENDYLSILINRSDGKPGKPYTAYSLTTDCFKSFCMMAETEKGKEVRKYYLTIEKAWNTPELVAARARQMGVTLPPAPEKPWSYYPFFEKPDFKERCDRLVGLYKDNLISRDELRSEILFREGGGPVKAVYTLSENPPQEEAAYVEAVRVLKRNRRPRSEVSRFAEKLLDFTGLKNDCIPTGDMYELFRKETGCDITSGKFIRDMKAVFPLMEHRQRKISGKPVMAFFGVKLKEQPG
jgi:phage anti-repressor protein